MGKIGCHPKFHMVKCLVWGSQYFPAYALNGGTRKKAKHNLSVNPN